MVMCVVLVQVFDSVAEVFFFINITVAFTKNIQSKVFCSPKFTLTKGRGQLTQSLDGAESHQRLQPDF